MKLKKNIPAISIKAQAIIDKVARKEALTEEEDDLLLTPEETAALLSAVKGTPVGVRYLPVLIRDKRLVPDSPGGGNSYRYRVGTAKKTTFNPRGNPKLMKNKPA